MPAEAAPAAAASWRRAEALRLLRAYAPEGLGVIEAYETTPFQVCLSNGSWQGSRADFGSFLRASTTAGLVAQLPVAVHESSHWYASKMGWLLLERDRLPWRACLAVPLEGGEGLRIDETPSFAAREAAELVPVEVRDMRHTIYMQSPDPNQSTQQKGIYGLVDELAAYYQGTRTAIDLWSWYRSEGSGSPEALQAYIGSVEGTAPARWQLRLFIAAWLVQAQRNHPEMAARALANRPLMQAIVGIDAAFGRALAAHDQHLAEVAGSPGSAPPTSTQAMGDPGKLGSRRYRGQVEALQHALSQPPFAAMVAEIERAAARR